MQPAPEAAKVGRVKLAFLVVAVAALLAAGCGGSSKTGGSSSSSSTQSPKDWANGLCSAITTWSDSVKSAGQSLQKGNLSKDALKQTTDDIQGATKTFADDLKNLGKPDTDAGQKAKDAIDQLSSEVDQDVETMQTAVKNAQGSGASGAVTAASTIASTLSKMGTQVGSAASKLQSVDAKGDLEKGFQDAPACKSLTG
jgi:gas vesicle protein